MDKDIKKTVAALIDRLAFDFVISGASSAQDVRRFIDGLRAASEAARKESFPFIVEAIDGVLSVISEIPDAESARRSEVLSFSITALQQLLAAKEEAHPEFASRLKNELARFSGAAGKEADLSAARLDELQVFIDAFSSYIEEIERCVLDLETCPSDKDILREIFRIFHTLKGEAGILGFKNIEALSHEIENLLEKMRGGEIGADQGTVAVVLSATDALKDILFLLQSDVPGALSFDISPVSDKIAALFGSGPCAGGHAGEEEGLDFTPSVPTLDLSEGTQMLTEFITESKDHLASAEESLLNLEHSVGDAGEINKIFREFHTIKGLASFLNLDDIRILAHDTENMMDLVRRGTLALTPAVAGIVFASIDASRKLFELLAEQVSHNGVLKSPYHDISPVIAAIRKMLQGVVSQEAPREDQKPKIGEILLKKEIITEDDLGGALERQETAGEEKKIGEILVETGAATSSQVERGLEEQKKKSIFDDVIRISVRKLDDLIDTTGELVIAASQVSQNSDVMATANAKLLEDVAQLGRIIRNIQGTVMSMRLVPIRPLFQKMQRLTRDLSKKLGRDVEIRLDGEETEIDKNIIDLMADPLVHMVRNALDHGIEPPDVRRSLGKPASGVIGLSASHEGGSIIIKITDDGAGIDKKKILAKARERGLVKAGEEPDEKDILNLIFEAGFSTAEKVTEISGRGVGMDVVKKNITQLRGKVEIDSRPGEGTAITLRLPLTLAIIDGITLTLGRERYILPIFSIKEFIHPKKKDVSTVQGRGEMISVHGTLYKVIRLDAYFDVRYRSADVEDLVGCLVESDADRACILFDELIVQQQVVIKSLGDRLKDIRGLAGATILGDGKVGLILDVNGIIEMTQKG